MPKTMTTETMTTDTMITNALTAEAPTAEPAVAGCVHHWVLAHPEDDVIRGRCKLCGAQREYPASVEGASRQGAYEEAAAIGQSVALLPDVGGGAGFTQSSERPY